MTTTTTRTIMMMKSAFVVLLCVVNAVTAFSSSQQPRQTATFVISRSSSKKSRQQKPHPALHQQRPSRVAPRLQMAEQKEEQKAVSIKSGQKDLVYDEISGRFYEAGKEEIECLPDEEYCVIDKESGQLIRLTVQEKERIFLDALQSYYATGRQLLSDGDFDLLKEDLQWSGSAMAQLNRREAQYLAAMQAYLKGSPIMNDQEFDSLKRELMEAGSRFAVSTEPKCYIDTGICKVTMQQDFFRTNLLYLPGGFILALLWLGLGYEILAPIAKLNPLTLLTLGAPLIYLGTKKFTEELVFQNFLVAFGPCPNCEAENRVYFGDILGVEGFGAEANVKCPKCKETFVVQRETLRASTLPKF